MGLFDEKQEPTIFEFGVDETAKTYLLQTVRWTKFMAIVGFIATALILFVAVVFFVLGNAQQLGAAMSTGLTIGYLLIGLLYIYPTIELWLFSTGVKKAFSGMDSSHFNEAMRHQRNMWRYLGILVIALFALYGVLIAFIITTR